MSAIDITNLRQLDPHIVCLGSHRGIVQSILDFDYLAGRKRPSVDAIVATGRKHERYFFGPDEVMLPVCATLDHVPASTRKHANLFLNLSSGRRVLRSTREAMDKLPALIGGVVFAEGLPERHAIELYDEAGRRGLWVIGGASVGLVVPGVLKLGAIGGTQAHQLEQSRLFTSGSVAVISSSGGMVNEVIRTVASTGHALSFSLALGGERFPMVTPEEAFLAAEADPETRAIAYFGELGGDDEYVLADLLQSGRVTKPVVAYIAGTVADLFETPPQFGHAKAMATRADESARAKREALAAAGAHAANSFGELVDAIAALPHATPGEPENRSAALADRRPTLMASSVSGDRGDEVRLLDAELLQFASNNSFARIVISMFLGRQTSSPELEQFVDFVLRLLVDHGPYVSGAVNTIVSARAGKDLVSSLASGLLTIGPRFGGAINQAAATWLDGVERGLTPAALVEELAAKRHYISGIGHRKYRVDLPDPRVERLLQFATSLETARFTTFARGVEAETVRKKGNLILNVDGAIAAILLDLLAEKEGFTAAELHDLVDHEFFNALFVLSRSVGFMAHYFDQVRLDEGIFRLTPAQVAYIKRDR
ncbi:MAG TPA: citrate/2-methylcitrate synthase [Candidatus Saccharimonadia bacterium]|jgi:succinyl-CoA synthetase alpha subunit